LVNNYCRNPDQTTHNDLYNSGLVNKDTIWCYTTDPATVYEYCDPLNGLITTTEIHGHPTSITVNANWEDHGTGTAILELYLYHIRGTT